MGGELKRQTFREPKPDFFLRLPVVDLSIERSMESRTGWGEINSEFLVLPLYNRTHSPFGNWKNSDNRPCRYRPVFPSKTRFRNFWLIRKCSGGDK